MKSDHQSLENRHGSLQEIPLLLPLTGATPMDLFETDFCLGDPDRLPVEMRDALSTLELCFPEPTLLLALSGKGHIQPSSGSTFFNGGRI